MLLQENFKWNFDVAIKMATLLVTVSVAVLVAFLNRFNMRYESREKQNRFKMDKQVEAGMAFWALLAYVTDKENEHAILLWTQEKDSKEKQWYFQKNKAKEFINKLSEYNYEKGHGFFLSPQTREHFYKYRSILYGICLKENNTSEDKVKIKREVAEEMLRMYERMNKALRDEIQPEKRDC